MVAKVCGIAGLRGVNGKIKFGEFPECWNLQREILAQYQKTVSHLCSLGVNMIIIFIFIIIRSSNMCVVCYITHHCHHLHSHCHHHHYHHHHHHHYDHHHDGKTEWLQSRVIAAPLGVIRLMDPKARKPHSQVSTDPYDEDGVGNV